MKLLRCPATVLPHVIHLLTTVSTFFFFSSSDTKFKRPSLLIIAVWEESITATFASASHMSWTAFCLIARDGTGFGRYALRQMGKTLRMSPTSKYGTSWYIVPSLFQNISSIQNRCGDIQSLSTFLCLTCQLVKLLDIVININKISKHSLFIIYFDDRDDALIMGLMDGCRVWWKEKNVHLITKNCKSEW